MHRLIIIVYLLFFYFFILNGQGCIPKNIIIFLGDGMGFEHILVSEYYQGVHGKSIWNSFKVKGALSTGHYGLDYNSEKAWQTEEYVLQNFSESAASATAISTGFRTLSGKLGVSHNGIHLTHLSEIAYRKGKSTGVVTNVPFSHATLAGFSIHHTDRNQYFDIAEKILLFSPLSLIMSAGHPYYDNNGKQTKNAQWKYIDISLWNMLLKQQNYYTKNSIVHYLTDVNYDFKPDFWFFSDNLQVIENFITTTKEAEKLFYIAPVHETFQYKREGISKQPFDVPFNDNVPSLSQLTLLALEHLSKNEKGFFLIVEGGAIDWASHDNNLVRLIEEMFDFENAISKTFDWLKQRNFLNETLVLVLSDHETGFLCGSFDKLKGFQHVIDNGIFQLPSAVFLTNDHTNHLVPFFAHGCGSEYFLDFDSKDPVRFEYMHLSKVNKIIKNLWGENVYIYPTSVKVRKNRRVDLFVSAPDTICLYKWYVNERPYDKCSDFRCKLKIKQNSFVFCEVQCSEKVYRTQLVNIQIDR